MVKKGAEMADLTPSWAFAAAITVALTLPAAAQTAGDIALGKRLYQAKAECGHCHGWSGDGAGDPLSPGKAANLRETRLDHDQLVETIGCGVPGGTAMPHFDRLAWTEGENCFGMTAADAGDKMPTGPTAYLSKREIEAIVAYLEAKVIGRGPPTVADCEEFFGASAPLCQQMAAGRRQ
jgi:mono/diheme cytochrome c family protein